MQTSPESNNADDPMDAASLRVTELLATCQNISASNQVLNAKLKNYSHRLNTQDDRLQWLLASRFNTAAAGVTTLSHPLNPSSSFSSSINDIPAPSQWTPSWLDHFRNLSKLQYRDYLMSFHSELRLKMDLPVEAANLSIPGLVEKGFHLTSCLMRTNCSVALNMIDSNLVTGEKLKSGEEEAFAYQKAASATPLHLLKPGFVPKLKSAFFVYESKVTELEAEKMVLRERLEFLSRVDLLLGGGGGGQIGLGGGRMMMGSLNEDVESVCFSSHPSALSNEAVSMTTSKAEAERSRLRPRPHSHPEEPAHPTLQSMLGPLSAPSCSHPRSSHYNPPSSQQQGQGLEASLSARPQGQGLEASLSARPQGLEASLLARPQGLEASLSARPQGLEASLSARPQVGTTLKAREVEKGGPHFMTLEKCLDRLEQIFKQETHERHQLVHLVHKIASPMTVASVLLASFPYFLDAVKIMRVFLEELEKPDVLPEARQSVPHIFMQCQY